MTTRQHGTVLAAARGDDEALARVVHAYQERLYRFGRRVCRDEEDAQDAVQEAFAKLLKRPDVVQDRSALSWLMSVVRNACLRILRPFLRERRHLGARVSEDTELAAELLDPQQALERWELVQSVHAAIAALERPYREVLLLRDLEGLDGQETCALLGLEPATMKTRLHRARSQLRQALQGRAQAAPPRQLN